MDWYYQRVIAAFVIWAAFWAVLICSGRVRFTLRVLFIIVTGFAVMSAIAGDFIRFVESLRHR
jgi:hypothetical protein